MDQELGKSVAKRLNLIEDLKPVQEQIQPSVIANLAKFEREQGKPPAKGLKLETDKWIAPIIFSQKQPCLGLGFC